MRQTKNSFLKNIYPVLLRYLFKVHADRYSRAKDYKGWQQQKLKTTFSQENSQNDERWSKLRKRSCNKKSMFRRIILLKLPHEAREEKGCYRNGSETREPLKRWRENRERPLRMNYYNQENQSAKSPQKNNLFLEKKASKQRDMHKYKFGVKSLRSMKLHR